MKRMMILILLIWAAVVPVSAVSFRAPPVPASGAENMPLDTENFSRGLTDLVRNALGRIQPDLREASRVCLEIFASVILMSLLRQVSSSARALADLTGALLLGGTMLKSAHSLIRLGVSTVEMISEYGKLLLPVMAGALSAQGGITASAALYAGTAFFDMVLTSMIVSILVPLVYVLLALSVGTAALGQDLLGKLRDLVKWAASWFLKTVLYLFTGYMGITGVISGSTDNAVLKMTRLTISGMVPVVGGIMADASEAVLVGAGAVKNAAGIYGLLAILALWIGPFLKIGIHYLLLKMTAALCSVFDCPRTAGLVQDFSCVMGLVCAMTGSVCLMLMISTVCFLKGVG